MKTAIVFAAICVVIASAGPVVPVSRVVPTVVPVVPGIRAVSGVRSVPVVPSVAVYRGVPVVPAVQNVVVPSVRGIVRNEADAQIVNIQNDNIGIGGYNFGFETTDGQKREEHAQIVIENDEPSQVVTGSYSYIGDDGQTYTVNYTADKYGFHPEGAHLHQPTH